MSLVLADYTVDADDGGASATAQPPPLRLPLHTLLAVRGQLPHGSVVSVSAPPARDGLELASLARVELAPAAALSAALADALGLRHRDSHAPPLSVIAVDTSSARLASDVTVSLVTISDASGQSAILQPDDVLRVRDPALLVDVGCAAQAGDAEHAAALAAKAKAGQRPANAAASLTARQPALEAVLDGALLHTAPGGQLLRVPLFGPAPGGTVLLRLRARCADGDGDQPALTRVARGFTRVAVALPGTIGTSPEPSALPSSADLRTWLAAATARAPGQGAVLARLVAQAASAWGLPGTPALVPQAALLVGPPGAGKTVVAEAVACAAGRPVYRLTALQLYRGGVGDSEASLHALVAHATAHGPSTVIVEDTETLLPATPRSPLAARLAALLLRCIRDGGVPCAGADGSSSSSGDTTSPSPSSRGRHFWVACATSLSAVDRRLLGPGACDGAVVELPLPGPAGREAMLTAILARRQASVGSSSADADSIAALASALAARTHGYSPADMEEAVRAAALTAMAEGATRGAEPLQPLTLAHFAPALAVVRPSLMLHAVGGQPRPVPLAALVGCDAAVAAAADAVLTPLRHASSYAALGVPPPRGLLITGPGGTGKTALAHALAHAAVSTGLANALVVSGPDIVSALVGSSEAALAALFARARQLAPCVLVLDAFDTLAPVRRYGGVVDDVAPLGGGTCVGGRRPVSESVATGKPQRKTPRDAAASSRPAALGAATPTAAPAAGPAGNRAGDRLLSVLLTEMDGVDGGGDGASGGVDGDAATALCADGGESAAAVSVRLLSALPSLLQLPTTSVATTAGCGSGSSTVVIVAVAPHPSQLDPAVLRPGRLDTHVATVLPDAASRAALLAHFFGRSPLAIVGAPREALPIAASADRESSCDNDGDSCTPRDWAAVVDVLVAATAGWCHADVEALWREAAMGALRHGLTGGTTATAAAAAPDGAASSTTDDGSAIAWSDIAAALRSVGAVRRGLRAPPTTSRS